VKTSVDQVRIAKSSQSKNRIADGQTAAAWILGAPALILLLIFIVIPFIMSVGYSFTNKMLVPNIFNPLRWVGLENYFRVFTDNLTRLSFVNTAKFTILTVAITVVLATVMAVFVNKAIRGIGVYRFIYFSPQVVSTTVVAVIWSFIFSPSDNGLLNSFFGLIGLQKEIWLKDPKLALNCIAVMSIWQTLGMQMLIILGGLQFIPHEIYEAATVDGCTNLQKFLYITVPMLKNTLTFVLITNTIASLKLFTQVYVLTDGGPQNSTTSLVYLMYNVGFTQNQVGYASAIAVVFFMIVLVISLLQNKLLSRGD
jgi:multiple sugar transport system permease protein